MKIPKYMTQFKCIGTPCEDNCCVGWDVDIDEKTFKKYVHIGDKQLKRDINKYVSINPYCYDPNVDYAFISLNEQRRCQFLNSDNLCLFHKIVGESYLSNVCSTFPRIYNRIDQTLELSSTSSCPEVVKLLEAEDAMMLIHVNDESPRLMTYEISQNDKRYKSALPSKLQYLRNLLVETMLDQSFSLDDRMYRIAKLVIKSFEAERKNKIEQLETMLDAELKFFDSDSEASEGRILKSFDLVAFTELTGNFIEMLLPSTSDRFNQMASLAETSLQNNHMNHAVFLVEIAKQDTLISNYFGNQIFRTLFPFTEGNNVDDGLKLFLVRYGIFKRHMLGLSNSEALSKENLSKYLQSFSKVFEHHKHFELDVLDFLKQKKIKSKDLVAIIIGSIG